MMIFGGEKGIGRNPYSRINVIVYKKSIYNIKKRYLLPIRPDGRKDVLTYTQNAILSLLSFGCT